MKKQTRFKQNLIFFYNSGIYNEQLYKVSYDLGNSLEKIEQFYNELKFRDQLVLNKIKTYKVKETEIQTKKRVLENLIKDSHLSQSNFEILINENTLIDEEFFKALESLDKLHSLQESLGQRIFIYYINSEYV